MNSLERSLAIINHQKADRVPVIPQDSHVAAKLAGYDHIEFAKDPKKVANAQIACCERFGFDGIIMGADTTVLAEAIGVEVRYSTDIGPSPVHGCLNSYDDLNKLKPINPWKDGRLPVWIEATRLMVEKVGTEKLIVARADQGAFSLASMIRGFETFFEDLVSGEKTESIHALLRYCNDCMFEFIKALKSVGAHVVTTGDSISGPEVVSPVFYEQYSFPYEADMANRCKKLGVPFAIHICGNTDKILDKWVESGAEIFEIDHKTDFELARKVTAGKVTLLGNLDCSGVMLSGTPELVEQKAKEIIEICMPQGELILSSGCLLGGNTPPENMQALADSARKYGVFTN
jgi:MtaA/CmuA family methyltransferase